MTHDDSIRAITPPKRGRKKLRTPNPEVRERLLRAGNDLIREQGFPELRVDEVTERAGLSVGTFYLYFESKDDLFTSLVVEHTRSLRAELRKAYSGDGSVAERLSRGLEAYLDFVEANERGFLYFRNSGSLATTAGNLSSWTFEQHGEELRPLLEEGMASGEIRQQDLPLLTQAMLGVMQHVAGYWMENKPRLSRREIAAFLAATGGAILAPPNDPGSSGTTPSAS